MNDLGFIFCAPLSRYPEKPKDYSLSELIKCDHCGEKMWYSIKKKEIREKNPHLKFWIGCMGCFEKFVKNNREIFIDSDVTVAHI